MHLAIFSSFFQKIFIAIAVLFIFFGNSVFAAPEDWNTGNIRIKYEYQHFILHNAEQYIYQAEKIDTPTIPGFCFADEEKNTEKRVLSWEVDTQKIKKFLIEKIAPDVEQKVSNVSISKDKNGAIQFEGYGYKGVTIDLDTSAELIAYAIKTHSSQVTLAVHTTEPKVLVEDEELKNLGIKEVIAVGRSNFYPSSRKRLQNIMAGANRFNGILIKPGEEFSFNTQLGLVDKSTGYAEEYVILGPKVVKEYGGGLCQVSSTAYRGAMIAGLKILERHEHSFAVSHYKPYGSDATIYQGVKDFRFKNDSDTAILIQTRRGGKRNSELFFHYYGTKTNREVKIFGPIIENRKKALPSKITYSSSMKPGTSQKVSSAVRGFDSSFGRIVTNKETGKQLYKDTFFSRYQPRGNWTIRGGPSPSSSETSRPQFIPPLTE